MANTVFDFFQALWFVPMDIDEDEPVDSDSESDNDQQEPLILETTPKRKPPQYLRPKSHFSAPRRLVSTPTKSHIPMPRIPSKTYAVSRQCPHCLTSLRVDRKSYKVTKPRPVAPRLWERHVTVFGDGGENEVVSEGEGEDFVVEDRSPTVKMGRSRRL